MIIVSQNKKEIVNYYNIVGIEVKNNKILAYGNDCNNNFFYNLGKYKTEERAKEVLQEIYIKYDNIKRYNEYTSFIYEMPEK